MTDNNKIDELFSEEEKLAISLGFPISDDLGINADEVEIEDYVFFIDDEIETEKPFSFVSDIETDNDFENFLTKKMRDRAKKRKDLRKSGVSRKDARKQAKDLIPPDTLKDALKKISINNIKKDFGKLGRGVAVVSALVPRQAFIGLVAINYRGIASKLEAIIYGKDENLKNKLKDKWYKIGGDYAKLVGAVNRGRNKKPFFCGAKCKSQASKYSNAEPTTTTTALITTGGAIIGYLASVLNQAKISKTKEKEIQALKDIAEKETDQRTEAEKLRAENERKAIESQTDPRNLILNNANLTKEEKQIALKQYDETFGKERRAKLIKYSVIGAIALGGIFLLTRVLRKK